MRKFTSTSPGSSNPRHRLFEFTSYGKHSEFEKGTHAGNRQERAGMSLRPIPLRAFSEEGDRFINHVPASRARTGPHNPSASERESRYLTADMTASPRSDASTTRSARPHYTAPAIPILSRTFSTGLILSSPRTRRR